MKKSDSDSGTEYLMVFRRPESKELEKAIRENREAINQASTMMKLHISLNGTSKLQPEGETAVGAEQAEEEVVEKEVREEPDFYPSHVPVQYHEMGLFTRLVELLKFW